MYYLQFGTKIRFQSISILNLYQMAVFKKDCLANLSETIGNDPRILLIIWLFMSFLHFIFGRNIILKFR